MFSIFITRKKNKHPIDWEAALSQCMDNEDLLRTLLISAYEDIKNPINNIKNGPNPIIKDYAHMVKGLSRNLYLKDIENISISLEKAAIIGDKKEIKKQIKYMKNEVKYLKTYLKCKNILK